MTCETKVTIGGQGTRVTVQGGSAARITMDRRTTAIIADHRPRTVPQARNTAVDVTSRPTTVKAGNGMGVQGPKGEPGTDVGSTPTISAESAELFTLLRGMPVALVAGKLRRATALPPFNEVVGLVHDESILAGAVGRVQTDGPLEQPAAEWEVITGMPGGIAPDAVHFLSPTGELTPFAPADEGQVVAPVGRATTPTTFVIDIDTQVHL